MTKQEEIRLRYHFEAELLRLTAIGNYRDIHVQNLWLGAKAVYTNVVAETTQKGEEKDGGA